MGKKRRAHGVCGETSETGEEESSQRTDHSCMLVYALCFMLYANLLATSCLLNGHGLPWQ
jgi:hypothetical protein